MEKRGLISFIVILSLAIMLFLLQFGKAEEDETLVESVEKDRILVIRGTGFNRLRVNESLTLISDIKIEIIDIEGFQWTSLVHNLSRRPGRSVIKKCLSFTIVDTPTEALGSRLTKMLTDEVNKGAILTVIGGPFAFGKGGYRDTPFEEILPVKSKGEWDIIKLDKPEPMKAGIKCSEIFPLEWDSMPTVEYLHDVILKEGADVLIKAGDYPILTRMKVGEGYSYAFTGVLFGTDKNGFWEWRDWSKFVFMLIKGGSS